MPGSCRPSPLDFSDGCAAVDAGTLCRNVSLPPGPTCASKEVHSTQQHGQRSGGSAPPSIPFLQLNDRGARVHKLQSFLNLRLGSASPLKVDGYFGPLTLEAVLKFQTSRSLKVDGIVGKATWYCLVRGTPAVARTPGPGVPNNLSLQKKFEHLLARAAQSVPARASAADWRPPLDSVMDWPLTKKFVYVIGRVPKHLPAAIGNQFLGLVSVPSLAILLTGITLSCVFGVGELIMAGAFLILGEQVFIELAHTTQITALAASEGELDEAAWHLASAFAIGGVQLLLLKLPMLFPGKTGATEEMPEVDEPEVKTSRPPADEPLSPKPSAAGPPTPHVTALVKQLGDMLINGKDPMPLLTELSRNPEGRALIRAAHVAVSAIMKGFGGEMPPEVFRLYQQIQSLTFKF